MCPDTSLLAASIDGTLFPGDARAVDLHLDTCASCAHVLGRLRQQREAEVAERNDARSRAFSRRSALAGVVTLVALGGSLTVYGLGGGKSGTNAPPRSERPVAVRLTTAVTPPRVSPLLLSRTTDLRCAMKALPRKIRSIGEVRVEPASTQPSDPGVAKAVAIAKDVQPAKPTVASSGAPPSAARPHLDTPAAAPEAALVPARASVQTESPSTAGLVVRAKNGKPAWRARGGVIEHSADGGTTWAEEYSVDHAIVAGAYVAPEVAWLAGADGVILRRTSVGWFETSARADGEVASIRASSPTKASITLVDGRTFETKNAGVAWTEALTADQPVSADPRRTSASKKRGTAPRRHSKHPRR